MKINIVYDGPVLRAMTTVMNVSTIGFFKQIMCKTRNVALNNNMFTHALLLRKKCSIVAKLNQYV